MDIEEVHTILKGATRVQHHKQNGTVREDLGADFDLTLKWFKQCGIIDGVQVTEEKFCHDYERLAPNREPLTLTDMIILFAIFARDTRVKIDALTQKFEEVKNEIIQEVREYWRKVFEDHQGTTGEDKISH